MRQLRVLLLVLAPMFAMAMAPVTPSGLQDRVELPFEPPIDRPVRYTSSYVRTAASGTTTITATDELTFRRSAKGFEVLWTGRSVTVDAPEPLGAMLTKIMSASVDVPIRLELTPQGEPERIANLAEIRAMSDRYLDEVPRAIDEMMAGEPAEARAMIRNLTEQLAAQQRAQTPDEYEAEVMQAVSLLLGWSAFTLAPGKPVTVTVEDESPIEGSPMTLLSTMELTDFAPGKSATIKVTTSSGAIDVRAETAEDVDSTISAAAAGNPRLRAELEAQAKQTLDQLGPVSASEEKIAVIDLPSGLPRHVTYRKRVAIEGGRAKEESRDYRRID